MLTSSAFRLTTLNQWLNPWYASRGRRVSLSPLVRCLRAAFITGRNLGFLVAAVFAVRQASGVLPPGAVIAGGLGGAAVLVWQIRARDRRGEDVSPSLTLMLFGLLFILMAFVRSLADQAGFHARYEYVIRIDEALLGGVTPTVWLQQHFYVPGAISLLDVYTVVVYMSYFTVPILAGVALWHLRPAAFRLYLTAMLVTVCLGTAYFVLIPTAPPWLAGVDGYLPPVARIPAAVMEQVRPGFYERGYEVAGINDVASFPSYHMAETALVVLALWRYGARVRFLGLFYALSMGFSLVYLGEHYVCDVIAGILLAAFAWRVALRLTPSTEIDRRSAGFAGNDAKLYAKR